MPTPRLTQQYQTTTSPLSLAMRPSLCSHQVSNCLVCPCVVKVVFGWRWLSRAALGTIHSAAQCLSTMSISRTLERDTFRRCFLAQPAPTALQRFCRRKRALLLRDLVATADLPPRNALFSLQLLDLTHRWWAAREDLDIDIHDVHPFEAAVYIHFTLHSARYPDPVPFQLADPGSQPAP